MPINICQKTKLKSCWIVPLNKFLGPLWPFLYYITIKLGRIFRIRPLARPLNFIGCRHFCWAGFKFCGLKVSQLATVDHIVVEVRTRVRRSFRLEAKRCEKGSEKNFAFKRNKGLVSLVSLRSETEIFSCETKWIYIKRKITKRKKLNKKVSTGKKNKYLPLQTLCSWFKQ